MHYKYQSFFHFCGFAIFFCLFGLSTVSPAAQQVEMIDTSKVDQVIKGEKDAVPLLSDDTVKVIDEGQETVTQLVASAANWIDSFFDDDRVLVETNKTRGKLKLSAGIDRVDDFQFKPRLSFRLHLPKANDKVNLVFSANDDQDFELDNKNMQGSKDDESNVSAGVQYFLTQSKKLNISTTAGLSFDYLYVGIRHRGFYNYGSWQGRLTNRVRWYTDSGFESKNLYDIERKVSDNLFFRTSIEANWEEELSGVPHSLTFALFQVLKADRVILYEIGNYFNTRPDYAMTDNQFRLRYRQRFYRDWLVFEVAPQVSFPLEHDREFNPGLILRLEAVFGYKTNLTQFNNIFAF